MILGDQLRRRSSHRQRHVLPRIFVGARRWMQVRTRMCAVGLILSVGAPFGGLLVPENSVSRGRHILVRGASRWTGSCAG